MNFGWLVLSYFLVFLQSIYQIVVAVYAQNKLGEMRWMYQTYVFAGIVIVGFIVLVIVQLLEDKMSRFGYYLFAFMFLNQYAVPTIFTAITFELDLDGRYEWNSDGSFTWVSTIV